MTKMKKYDGIGRLLIAFGIKLSIDNGCGGDVTFQAKTPELAKHYVKDFGAFPVSPTVELLPGMHFREKRKRKFS